MPCISSATVTQKPMRLQLVQVNLLQIIVVYVLVGSALSVLLCGENPKILGKERT